MTDGNQNFITRRLRSLVSMLRLTSCKSTNTITSPNDHCHVCSVPFSSQAYRHVHICGLSQCVNGLHLTCPYCCTRLYKETKIECGNKTFERVKHEKKSDQQIGRVHTICFCPACTYANYPNKLYDHREITSFTYGCPFYARVEKGEKRVFLQEKNEGVIFALDHRVLQETGRVLSVDCIGPPTLNKGFMYKLTVRSNECSYMKSMPKVHRKWDEHISTKGCLYVHCNIDQVLVKVLIDKIM